MRVPHVLKGFSTYSFQGMSLPSGKKIAKTLANGCFKYIYRPAASMAGYTASLPHIVYDYAYSCGRWQAQKIDEGAFWLEQKKPMLVLIAKIFAVAIICLVSLAQGQMAWAAASLVIFACLLDTPSALHFQETAKKTENVKKKTPSPEKSSPQSTAKKTAAAAEKAIPSQKAKKEKEKISEIEKKWAKEVKALKAQVKEMKKQLNAVMELLTQKNSKNGNTPNAQRGPNQTPPSSKSTQGNGSNKSTNPNTPNKHPKNAGLFNSIIRRVW